MLVHGIWVDLMKSREINGKVWELQVWTAPGWVIYPELKLTAVSTANPGYGLSDAQKRHIEKCQKANSKLYDNRLMISWKPF